MDRRQRKTRESIFNALTRLLSKKDFSKITVGDIIAEADIGRATFYAHFETKDFLLKELCGELFCHIFDTAESTSCTNRHIFMCNGSDSVFLHLFQHFEKNDNNLLVLLSSRNNELFLKYFKSSLITLIDHNITLFDFRKDSSLPDSLWKNHIASTFIETLMWWVGNNMLESPETITEYFFKTV